MKYLEHNSFSFPFKYNWSEREFFIYSCFVDDLQQFYKDWIEQGKKIGRIQFFDINKNDILTHKYWRPSNKCRDSGDILTKDNIDIKIGYWTPNLWYPIRKDFKQESMKLESFLCQKIDCSCNDCKFLDRKNSFCQKLNKKVNICSNQCHPQNQICFEHRKDKPF
jgi:hypothetical protein